MDKKGNELSRREFLKRLGIGTFSAAALMGLEPLTSFARKMEDKPQVPGNVDNRMTYRINRHSGDKVSLLGYGMMRLPQKDGQIDQEMVNQEVDYAIAHGINYFDTAPVYGRGQSEVATGIALSRHPRDKYMIATKMSNQNQRLWDFDKAKEMYETSFKKLQVDYIDYYLLHSIGGGGMDTLRGRSSTTDCLTSYSPSERPGAYAIWDSPTTATWSPSTGCSTTTTNISGTSCR